MVTWTLQHASEEEDPQALCENSEIDDGGNRANCPMLSLPDRHGEGKRGK